MIETSPQINELATALAKAQAQIKSAERDATNPKFERGAYSTLESVWNVCRGPLTENGLAVIQLPRNDDGANVGVMTILTHASGQWVRSELFVQPYTNHPQDIGSAITYCRRFSLAAVAGVAPKGEDDDGNGTSLQAKPAIAGGAKPAREVPGRPDAPKVTTEQLLEISVLREKIGDWAGDWSHPKHPFAQAVRGYKDRLGNIIEKPEHLDSDQAVNLLVRMRGTLARRERAAANHPDIHAVVPDAADHDELAIARDRIGP